MDVRPDRRPTAPGRGAHSGRDPRAAARVRLEQSPRGRSAPSRSSSVKAPTGAHGSSRSMNAASLFTTLPMPATARWSSSAFPEFLGVPLAQPAERPRPRRTPRPAGPGRARAAAAIARKACIGQELETRRVERDRHGDRRSRGSRSPATRAASRPRRAGSGARSPASACGCAASGRCSKPMSRCLPRASTRRRRRCRRPARGPARDAARVRPGRARPRRVDRPALRAAPPRCGRSCRLRAWLVIVLPGGTIVLPSRKVMARYTAGAPIEPRRTDR